PPYLQEVHCPAITATVRRATTGRATTRAAALPALSRPNGGRVVAVFDLEGTLVASNVVETYLLARLADLPRAAWPGELLDLARALPRYLAAEKRDRGEFLRTFLRRYAGTGEAALHKLVADRIGDGLLRRAYPQAIRR